MAKKKTRQQVIGEAEEKIVAMGQESEQKAAKAVIEVYKEAEKEDKKEKEIVLEKLEEKRKRPRIYSYKEELAIYTANMIASEEPPKSHGWVVEIVEKGVSVSYWSLDKRQKRTRKFAICGDPKYDFAASEVLANWVLDNIYMAAEKKSAIILPN